jgi:hypothetical protein
MSYLVAGIILMGLSTMGETIFENLKNVSVLNISFHQTSPHQVAGSLALCSCVIFNDHV